MSTLPLNAPLSSGPFRYRWFVKGDVDGFFGLAVDNLVQVLVITALCKTLCGMSDALVFGRMLPGVAVSLLIGNAYYAWHAIRVARRDRNATCTALPYGINTPSVFAYIFFVIAPVYHQFRESLGDAAAGELAWKVGLLACIGSGIIEFVGSFAGSRIRRAMPRAALLSALAAVGVVFIASPFAFQIFERPLVAVVPMFVVLVVYFAQVRFPWNLPGGFVALVIGALLAWASPLWGDPPMVSAAAVGDALGQVGWRPPQLFWRELLDLLRTHPDLTVRFLGIIVPMGVVNVLGSLQNVESAEAGGDRFSTGPCMAVNGLGSLAAGLCGSCFPTTIYIGHPGWKALGARAGYSLLNGFFFTAAFFFGLGAVITAAIPMEAGIAIVLWIGVVITAQSYEVTPVRHFPAVAIGMFPAVAAMAMFLVPHILPAAGATAGVLPIINEHLGQLLHARTDDWWPIGVYALVGANCGWVITTMLISAISAFLIDRRFRAAAVCTFIAAGATLLGFQHAYRVEPGATSLSGQELLVWQRTEEFFRGSALFADFPAGTFLHRGYRIAAAYIAAGALLLLIHRLRARGRGFEDLGFDAHGASPGASEARRGAGPADVHGAASVASGPGARVMSESASSIIGASVGAMASIAAPAVRNELLRERDEKVPPVDADTSAPPGDESSLTSRGVPNETDITALESARTAASARRRRADESAADVGTPPRRPEPQPSTTIPSSASEPAPRVPSMNEPATPPSPPPGSPQMPSHTPPPPADAAPAPPAQTIGWGESFFANSSGWGTSSDHDDAGAADSGNG